MNSSGVDFESENVNVYHQPTALSEFDRVEEGSESEYSASSSEDGAGEFGRALTTTRAWTFAHELTLSVRTFAHAEDRLQQLCP